MVPDIGKESGFLFFYVDGGHGGGTLRFNVPPAQCLPHGRFNLLFPRPLLTADTQNYNPRNQPQHFPAFRQKQLQETALLRLTLHRNPDIPPAAFLLGKSFRQASHNREIAEQAHRLTGQNIGRHRLCRLHIGHPESMLFCKVIHCKAPVKIRGRGNHRDAPCNLCRLFRQTVGPSQMAGQKGNGVPAAIVDHHNGRIRPLVLHPRCNRPDRNPCSPDKYQSVPCRKLLPRPFPERGF